MKRIKILYITLAILLLCSFIIIGMYHAIGCYAREAVYDAFVQSTLSSKFSDFSTNENDFSIVADIANSNKCYILEMEYSMLLVDVQDDHPTLRTYEYDIILNEQEKQAVKNVHYAFYNEGIAALITDVIFINDDDLLFCSDTGQYAIVYSLSNHPNSTDIEGIMGQDASIVKLSECWYQVIRLTN